VRSIANRDASCSANLGRLLQRRHVPSEQHHVAVRFGEPDRYGASDVAGGFDDPGSLLRERTIMTSE